MNLKKLILSIISLTIILCKPPIQCMEQITQEIETTRAEIESFCGVKNIMLNNYRFVFESNMIKISDYLTIYSEALDNVLNEPLILIAGAGRSRIFWTDSFCKKLAETGFLSLDMMPRGKIPLGI